MELLSKDRNNNLKEIIRAERINLDMNIKSRTIGSNEVYELNSENVSRSGMLVKTKNKAKVPFIENTLIEMSLEPKDNYSSEKISLLAKVIRRDIDTHENSTSKDDDKTYLGLHIVQMEQGDLNKWNDLINTVEQNNNEKLKLK